MLFRSATTSTTVTAVSKKSIRRKENKAPKIVENTKKCIYIKGPRTSEVINQLLTELYLLKKPFGIKYQRKNQIRPFEDDTSLEFFSNKSDASQFVLGSHSKKRPHSLVFGRMFNYHVLEMVEVGVTNYKSMSEFTTDKKPMEGSRPAIIFKGEEFTNSEDHKRFGNLLLDLFRVRDSNKINLEGLDHVIILTSIGGIISYRHYMILLKKSGTKIPRVELQEVGPSFDMTIRRTKFASADLMKEALAIPPQLKPKSHKNKTSNIFGDDLGTVHMEKQNLNTMDLARMKAFKRKKNPNKKDEEPAAKKAKTNTSEEAE